ncbi:MAG: phosphate acyltransferase PlsX [Deltaproteobacteria bacterium]|nr:phosphate acyltransferase PlsX [Deltaproteobacteria bacterium]MBM4323551.1 phosphate acyltransferase PlsX [Deltaproteobacteria bacterium]MBM4346938.1 phosphate acyltransferase PlsX [Deltaproteobacteria bacterium]
MKIAVDAMGGDFAPQNIVEGAYKAAKEHGVKVVLVGDEDQVSKELSRYPTSKLPIFIHHTSHVVAMHDSPSTVLRRMKDSSIKVAIDLEKVGEVSGVVSAGNSGAAMALAMFIFKKLEGVDRPAIATIHPAIKGSTVLVDSGGNVDCKPSHLVQFALMGDAYAKYILGENEPRIGLLSNGEEEGKGNELTREVHEILSEMDINYIGYVEGRGLNSGEVDVIVCDGFVGNVALKISEGLWETVHGILKWEAKDNLRAKVAYFFMRRAIRRLEKRFDYSEYGGAPLLGVNGNCVICHGASNAKAIMNAIVLAASLAKNKLNEHLIQELKENQDLMQLGQRSRNGLKKFGNSKVNG